MVHRLVISSILCISMADGLLFKPRSKCVPTAAVQGSCHECICSTQGVYHCWHKKCDNNETETTDIDRECEPLLTYIEKGWICSCSITGEWRSTNCRNRFRHIQTKYSLSKQMLRTNIACTPDMLYLIDCNICRCDPDGIFKVSSCTDRPCSAIHKAQTCRPGDIERFGNELCACSAVNYFIDKLCFPINDKKIQAVDNKKLEKLVYADQPWRRTFVENYRCDQNVTFTMDCNACVCKKNGLECTNNVCETENISRSKKRTPKILPELKSADERCKPGQKYKFKCNICVCADDGQPTCTKMFCLEDYLLDFWSLSGASKTAAVEKPDISNIARTLPEIHKEDKCVPGQKYKMDCNICFCKNDGSLMCTKVLCLPQIGRKKNDANDTLPMTLNNGIKEASPFKEKKRTNQIPNLPKKECVPGKIYKNGCQICFCEDSKKAVCSLKKNACKEVSMASLVRYLEDVRPPFQPEEVENLPELPQREVKCQPGKSYKVDCNGCVCLASRDLICDELICLSYDDMHRIDADAKSKKRCKPATFNKTEENCVVCDCIKEKVKCNEVAGCISNKDKELPNWNNGKPKLTLDMFKETCMPGGVYRMDCNNCYCQDDSSLRCTQKTCLNYSQSKLFEKQRAFVIKNRL